MCSQVYTTAGYSASVNNLASVSLASDNVFGEDDGVNQIPMMTGSTAAGFTATLDIGVDGNGASVTGASEVTITPTTTPATVGATSAFVPMATPRRLLDTRAATIIGYTGSKPAAQSTLTLQVLGRETVPSSGVSAVVLSVALAENEAPGFLTAWPGGARPTASNLNVDAAGQTRANLVTVPVASDGTVQIYTLTSAHVVADVLGWFVPASSTSAGRLVPVPPARVLDTRTATRVGYTGSKPAAGAIVSVAMLGAGGLPASGVSAVVVNVTATEAAAPGYVTALPDATPPTTSNVNVDRSGQTVANQVVVPLTADGALPLYCSASTHLLVDVFGYYTDDTAASGTSGLFIPVSPYRVVDTRATGRLGAGGLLHLLATAAGTAAEGRSALAMNLTAAQPTGSGYITVWPAGDRPDTSSLNMVGVDTIANQAIVATGTEGVEVYTLTATDIVVDITGWYV